MICSIIIKVAQQKSTDQHFVTQQKSTARTQVLGLGCNVLIRVFKMYLMLLNLCNHYVLPV